MRRFIVLLFILQSHLAFSSYYKQNNEPIKIIGDHFFIGEFNDVVPKQELEIESGKFSPNKVNFYINHKRYVNACTISHTETHYHGKAGTTTVLICDLYEDIFSDYQSRLKLIRKRQGEKSSKIYTLTYDQENFNSDLSFNFNEQDNISYKNLSKKKNKNKVVFNYKGKYHIFNKIKNMTGLWDPEAYRKAPYFETKYFNQYENTILHHSNSPLATEVLVYLDQLEGELSKNIEINIDYTKIKKTCFQAIEAKHNGRTHTKCIAPGFKAVETSRKVLIDLSDIKETLKDYTSPLKILTVQKYMKKKPKITAKMPDNKKIKIKIKSKKEAVYIKLKKIKK